MSSNPAQIAQPVAIRAAVSVVSPGTGTAGGSVDFTSGGSPIGGCTLVPLQSGVAVCNTSFTVAGAVTVVAAYSGDVNNNPSTGALQLTVGKAVAGTFLAALPTAPAYGAPVTLGVLVLGAAGVAGPTGTVTISDGEIALATLPIGVDGRASLVVPGFIPAFSPGSHSISAIYNGDPNYGLSMAPVLVLVVGKGAATLSLASTAAQIAQPVKITATLSMAGTGTGTVDFSNGANPITGCTGVPVQAGAAICNTSFPQAGTVAVGAVYSGDPNTSSATASLQLTVGKCSAGAYLAATPPSSAFGAAVTIGVLVLGATGVAPPTGTVSFSDRTVTLGTQPLGSDGRATLVAPSGSIAALATGSHTIGAVYSGDANYLSATAPVLVVVVGKAAAGIALSASVAQIAQPVKITAAISPSSASGTVDFSNAGSPIGGCTGLPVLNGAAICNTSFPLVGTVAIGASYSGDANSAPGTGSMQLIVGKCNAGAYLATSPASPLYGAPITLGMLVLGAVGVAPPTGTVTFSDGTASLATLPLGSDGHVVLVAPSGPLPPLGIGAHSITAVYSGDANYLAVAAPALTVTVGKGPTSLTLVSVPSAPKAGQSVTLTATISPAGGIGIVAFSNGAGPIAGCTAVPTANGVAICATSFPQPGTFTIGATYSGDTNADPVSGSLQLTVGEPAKPTPAVSLSAVPAMTVFGAAVVFNASLSATSGGPTPTGTVALSDGTVTLPTLPLNSSGQASLTAPSSTMSPLIVGTHIISAIYSGDSFYSGSTATPLSVLVGKASTSTVLAAPFGGPLSASVAVLAPGAGTPTGQVQFSSGGVSIGTAVLLNQGGSFVATLLRSNQVGSVTATYLGDANFASSISAPAAITAPTAQVTVTSSVNPSTFGQSLSLTVSLIANGPGIPTGSVQMVVDGTTLGTASLSGGTVTFITTLAAGAHGIVANYAGDATYPASSGNLSQQVNKAQTDPQLTSGSSVPQGPAMLTATVVVVAPGAGIPTGSVKFVNAATNAILATVAMAGASAATPLPPTTDPIMAVYSGDANFQPSSSEGLTQLAVTNSASYAVISLAADEIVTLFGSKLGTATAYASSQPSDSLGGTTVKITDSAGVTRAAQIFYVSPTQASILIPAGVAQGPATLAVTNSDHATVSTSIAIAQVAPGLFTANGTGQGVAAAQAVRVHADGTQDPALNVAALDRQATWVPSPIDLGAPSDTVYLILYGTGIRHFSKMPSAAIGGKAVAVVFAGAQSSFPGLDQVNILLPSSLKGAGTVSIVLMVDGIAANTVTIGIQ